MDALQAEKELTGSLTFKLKEDKECTSKSVFKSSLGILQVPS